LVETNLRNNYYKDIISSIRIEQAMTTNTVSDTNRDNQTIIRRKIVNAIDIHRKAMELVRNSNSYVIIIISNNIMFVKGYVIS
jgi:hypothetical protein